MSAGLQNGGQDRAPSRVDLDGARARIAPGSRWAYAFAAFCVGIAGLLHWGIALIRPDNQHFTTFYPAVLFAALIGGTGPGVFAVLLGGSVAWWAFMLPHFVFVPRDSQQIESALIYLFAALLIVGVAERYRGLTKRLEDEENLRKLAVAELAHRLKNKIATIQSIISYQLRDSPPVRDALIGRLAALAATDDLILATQEQGAPLRAILAAELGPYEASRTDIDGPNTLLPPKLAMTMAMLIHELATNSAKYGALSAATGKLTICWSLRGNRLQIEWRECDGPTVAPPTSHGFGMRLLSRALDQFGGTAETTFNPDGLVCTLTATLPDGLAANMPAALEATSAAEFRSPSVKSASIAPADRAPS